MITATLLNNMGTEHALNALRAELPDDLMWLVDWVERLQPSDDECAILEAVEEAGFTPASIAALGLGSFSFTRETHQAKIGPIEAASSV